MQQYNNNPESIENAAITHGGDSFRAAVVDALIAILKSGNINGITHEEKARLMKRLTKAPSTIETR